MAQLRYGSAGVTAQEIDLSGPVAQQPSGVPAGIVGTSTKGPAFVPVTVALWDDYVAKFGATDGKKFGPLAVNEWLRNADSVTYLRVLGIGDGTQRQSDGHVNQAGFTVGEDEPNAIDGTLAGNPYANSGSNSVPGRLYFLGAFMSESLGSTVFSSAGLQGTGSVTPGDPNTAVPIVRGVLMAPSGVILRLSSSTGTNSAPASTMIAQDGTANGSQFGNAVLYQGGGAKQDFVLILNGHQGTNPLYPNVITASFDMTSPNYFGNVLNKDPFNAMTAGHCLYASYDIHPATAVVTGTNVVATAGGAGVAGSGGQELSAFLTTGSMGRNAGSSYVPNYEAFTDRFSHARSPWVISQKFGGRAQNLFKLHALDAGANVSTLYKISIENIAQSSDPQNQYGTFDIVLRDFNDNDNSPTVLEAFRGCTLDPGDDKYVAKVVGDLNVYFDFDHIAQSQKVVVEGNYQNASNLVRVEMDPSVDSQETDPTSLPFGFRGPLHLVTSGSMPMTSPTNAGLQVASVLKRATQMPLPMRKNVTVGSGAKVLVNPQFYWGTQFEHVTTLAQPNGSTLHNKSIDAFAKYFPEFGTTTAPFVAGDNAGVADTAQNGIMDSDRFNLNLFSLENIAIVTGSAGTADPNAWAAASYVRNGAITPNDSLKTRRVNASDFTQANRRFLKFSFFMQGGFDGVNVFDRDESQLNNNAVAADMNTTNRGRNFGPNVSAYSMALHVMSDVTNTDIQLLAVPGIREPIVTDAADSAVQDRFDSMFIMDIQQVDSTNAPVKSDSQIPDVGLTSNLFAGRGKNTNFSAAYFPDTIVTDPTTKTNVVCPPSVAVLGAMALNDAVGHPWFAPAGFARGALQSTLEARVKLSKGNMDTLYDVNINPLVAFPGNATAGTNPKGGVVVWGQKTLQQAATALNRVNVRRLLIEIRRQVRDITQTVIFEPNRDATLAKFSAAVTPRLQRIQALSGLDAFKVVIDSSTTTQQDVLNNTIRGKIFVVPTKTTEYVSIDFAVANNANQR